MAVIKLNLAFLKQPNPSESTQQHYLLTDALRQKTANIHDFNMLQHPIFLGSYSFVQYPYKLIFFVFYILFEEGSV
jgi:hypothetical protein